MFSLALLLMDIEGLEQRAAVLEAVQLEVVVAAQITIDDRREMIATGIDPEIINFV